MCMLRLYLVTMLSNLSEKWIIRFDPWDDTQYFLFDGYNVSHIHIYGECYFCYCHRILPHHVMLIWSFPSKCFSEPLIFFPIFIALVAQCFYAQRILNLFISAERTQQLISLINANAFHIWHLSYGLNARRQQIPKIIGLPIPVFCMIARLQFYLWLNKDSK